MHSSYCHRKRHHEWIVFRRQPDRKIGSTEDDNGDNSITDSISDDDLFFSAEAEEVLLGPMADDPATTPESERDLEKKNSSTDVSDRYKEKAKPQMSNQPCVIHPYIPGMKEIETPTSTHQTDQEKKKKKKRQEEEKQN